MKLPGFKTSVLVYDCQIVNDGESEMRMDWTEKQDNELMLLWANGLSATAIAVHMGDGRTRSAVMGRLNRVGKLKTRADINRNGSPSTWPKKLPPERKFVVKRYRHPRAILSEPASEHNVTLAQLKPHHCRWPVGDPSMPSFRFCGETRAKDTSYCAYHYAKSVQPVKEKDNG